MLNTVCLTIEPVQYHFCDAPDGERASDPSNTCDTPETVERIIKSNAALKGLCNEKNR